MFWAVDTNLDSHGPRVGDISTQRGPSVPQCPGWAEWVRVRVCVSVSVSRTNQSPGPGVLYSHSQPKERRDAQNSECSALTAWLSGPQWWSCPGLGPVLYLVSAWPMSHICGAHNHKISQVFLTLFTVKWKWRKSENRVNTSEVLVY